MLITQKIVAMGNPMSRRSLLQDGDEADADERKQPVRSELWIQVRERRSRFREPEI